ncbi:MAG TPA: beta-propeller fold lactonase family protein [Verrucomicrobiae bacterium]|nr:beta-propeller fold lactonase family protein [Verrucomicrobiae bacterium]
MASTRLVFCGLLILASTFTIGCGSHSNKIGTCTANCPEEQAIYATTNSGQILTFPFPLGYKLLTPSTTAGPANSAGILVFGSMVYVSDPGNSTIRVYIANNQQPGLSPASVGPFAIGATPGALASFGQTLYVANSGGEIFAFTMNSDGSLTGLAGSPFAAGMGLSHLAVANLTNSNFLYGSNSDDPNGSISAFTINSNGSLTPVQGSPFSTVPNGGPEGLNVSGENDLYVALKNANAVAGFSINGDGSLSPIAGSPFSAGKGTLSLSGCDCGPNAFLFASNSLDGTISAYSIDASTGLLAQTSGSPFTATTASGDVLFVEGELFLPDASSNTISGFVPNLSNGSISAAASSPFQAGSGPLALAYSAFPPLDPP